MNILVALDNSKYSFRALQEAVEIARLEKAELTLITVYPDYIEVAEIPQKARDAMLRQAQEVMAAGVLEAEKAGLTPKAVIEAGSAPADNIVDYAAANHMDMIVMGHKSKSGIERLMVGSVAAKVVAYAPCSVLVVR
jgi:nucleotide-binding universal stress UspA family protein